MKTATVPNIKPRLELSLTYDEGEFRAALASLSQVANGEKMALSRAVNKALNGTRTDIVADLRSRTVLKAGLIRKGITVNPSRWKSVTQFAGSVRVATKRIPLNEYKVSPLRITAQKGRLPSKYKAVSYRLARGGKSFGNAPQNDSRSKLFVATLRGRLGVFMRPGTGPEHYRHLMSETGPSLQAFYARTTRQQEILRRADARFRKELAHQVAHLGGGGR